MTFSAIPKMFQGFKASGNFVGSFPYVRRRNIMTFRVTPNMVQSFRISGSCMERVPCGHSCKITLSDGREKTTGLDGDEIYALINVIAKDKIVGNDRHFNDYKDFEGNVFPWKQNNYSRPIPEEILSKVFKNSFHEDIQDKP